MSSSSSTGALPPTPGPAAPGRGGAPVPAAVLWDMDGTLVESEPYWIDSEFALVAEHGGSWSLEHAHSLVGKDLREAARRLRTDGGVDMEIDDIVRWLLRRVRALVRERVPWRPGAEQLLGSLRAAGVPCALVTMSWAELAEEVAALLPGGTFAALVTGDAVARPKPHPDPYLEAARRLGVDPGACVALEDSTTGVTSALAAGVPTVGIPYLVHLEAAPGLVRVPTLVGRDLAWLRRVVAGEARDEVADDPTGGRPGRTTE